MDWEEKPRFDIPTDANLYPLELRWKTCVGRVSERFNYFLRDYQREGIKFLWDRYQRNGGAILADDMGLGKTVQIIGFLSALYSKTGRLSDYDSNRLVITGDSPAVPTLIICPGSVLCNWEEEFKTWAHFVVKKFYRAEREPTLKIAMQQRCEIVLTTFETAREHIENLNRVDWKVVIVDECHRIKEPNSAVTVAMKSLGCQRKIGLTGTALQNKYNELWCLLDWANPGCLGSSKHFQTEFSAPMTKGFRIDATKLELATAREKQKHLNELKSAWMLRRTKTKTIASQLPEKKDQVVFCSLTPIQITLMEQLVAHPDTQLVLKSWQRCTCGAKKPRILCCWKSMKNKDGTSPKSLLLQLMHVFIKASNHAALLLPGKSSSTTQLKLGEEICANVFSQYPKLKKVWETGKLIEMSDTSLSGKMCVLSGLLHVMEGQGDKVLLFSYSTKVLDILSLFLESKGYTYRRLDGSTKTESRQRLVSEFNTDPVIFVFLVSTKAGGIGLNITGANSVIIFDPNWNPSHDLQAQDRAYRIGQTRDVNVYRLISVGCIEEIIYLRQVYKQQLSASSVDGEAARRYFFAVQGDSKRRGELFGIRNLFRVDPEGSCLTLDIEQRNKTMEAKVRGKTKSAVNIQESLLKRINLDEDPNDPYMIGLPEDLEPEDQDPKNISQVLSRSGVVYSHTNQGLVGSSRAEQHISKCAAVDMEEDGIQAGRLPADHCKVLSSTQAILEDEEEKETTGYQPMPPGSKKRITREGNKTYIYGNTPRQKLKSTFKDMADNAGISTLQLSRRLQKMSFYEKLQLLKDHWYKDSAVDRILEEAETDFRRESKNEVLRKISYNSPGTAQNTMKCKRKMIEATIPAVNKMQKTNSVSDSANNLKIGSHSNHKSISIDDAHFSDEDDYLTKIQAKEEFSDDETLLHSLGDTSKISDRSSSPLGTCSKTVTCKPPPPGEFYVSSRGGKKQAQVNDIDEIFDDSEEFNNIFADVLKDSRHRTDERVRMLENPSSEDLLDLIFKDSP